ncbi:ABC transporter ATP-binding protein [Candidatus Bipolaricaulota bacterium]|nr:ABC transporter ATP-binding protein [Candidatus Bipolaricaulota bacterium]
MGAELVLEKLTKVFRGRRESVVAVDHLDLSVAKGELLTLLGPSGCGKTTTLRMVGGFEDPTEGRILLGGQDITRLPPQRRNTATVFQSYGLFPHMTVFENVAFGLKVRRVRRREVRDRVKRALELVGLAGLEHRPPSKLSGGQQQRVALSRALVIEPRVLLFDEPLSNLDAKLRVETREQIRRLQKELDITSLYVTHDQAEAMAISDRIVIMCRGLVQQVGSPYEIYARPANTFVADFIGRANFLKARVVAVRGEELELELVSGRKLSVPALPGFAAEEAVLAVVRPEAADLVPPEAGDIEGTVGFAHYTGALGTYRVDIVGGEPFNVEVQSPQERGFLQPGTRVGLRLHRTSIHLLREE